jgi:hypothetical protein
VGSLATAPNSLPTSDSILTGTFSDSELGVFDSDLPGKEDNSGRTSTCEMVVSPNTATDIKEFEESSVCDDCDRPKTKWCIEKEYIHDISVDHSNLPEELRKRTAVAAELAHCHIHNSLPHTKQKQNTSAALGETRTPSSTARSSAHKMFTSESLRRLMKIVSPSTRRRRSPDVHSSGSSLSGDTLTGSTRSVSGVGELSEIRSPSSDLMNTKD